MKKDLLDDVIGVQEHMMYQVHTFGKVIEGQILPEFEKMVLTYKKEMEPILADGKRYLEDIELAEGNVQTAYREYRDQAQALEKMGVSDSELDLWVFEMQYRVAVGLLLETWKVCRSALGALFKRMKDAEMTRRRVTHAALGTVLGQQTTYWKRLPEYGLTLPSQVHPRVSEPRLIEKEIGADVRTGVQRLQHSQEGWRRKIVANRPMPMRTPTPFTSAPGLGGTSVDWSSNSINLALSTNAVAAGAAAGGEVKGVRTRSSRKQLAKEFTHVLKGPLDSPLTKRVQIGGTYSLPPIYLSSPSPSYVWAENLTLQVP